MVKKKYTFIEVLGTKRGKEIIEALEHIGSNPKDKELKRIRISYIKELKRRYNYNYR